MPELQGIKHTLTEEEKSTLRKTSKGTGAIAVMMVAMVMLIGGFSYTMVTGFMIWVLGIFLLFFLFILGFIVYTRIQHARATEKIVYTGTVTEKKTEASRTRNSSLNEDYLICLDGMWFTVELEQFSQVHTGERVNLHCLKDNFVFRTETLSAAGQEGPAVHKVQQHVHQQHSRNYVHSSSTDSLVMTEAEKRFVTQAFWTALLLRFLLGGLLGYVLFFVIALFGILLEDSNDYENLALLLWADAILLVTLFILLNRKTYRIVRDLLSGKKTVSKERLIDKVTSNSRKSAPNAVTATRNYGANATTHYYLHTQNRWLPVSGEIFNAYETGQLVQIHESKKAKIFLGTGDENTSLSAF